LLRENAANLVLHATADCGFNIWCLHFQVACAKGLSQAPAHIALFWGIGLVFVANPTTLQVAMTPEKLYQKVLPSVRRLDVESQSGEECVGSARIGRRCRSDSLARRRRRASVWAVCADGQRVRVIGCIHLDALRDLTLLKLEKPLMLSAEVTLEWL